jgi:hypothetical protein
METADKITVIAGQTVTGINAQLIRLGIISGKVTNLNNNPLSGIEVLAYNENSHLEYSYSNENGFYSIKGLQLGQYKIKFDGNDLNYLSEWYNDQNSMETADVISIIIGQTVENVNASLQPGGSISGKVTDFNGNPLSWIEVQVHDLNGNFITSTSTDQWGMYAVNQLPSAQYKVLFAKLNSQYQSEWYNDQDSIENAERIGVIAGHAVENINAQLKHLGIICGEVKDSTGNPLSGITVSAYDENGNIVNSTMISNPMGVFHIGGLKTGAYRLKFEEWSNIYVAEWFNNKKTFETADAIFVEAGLMVENINVELEKLIKNESTICIFPGEGIWVMDYQEDGSVVSEQWSKQQPDKIRAGDVDGNDIADVACWFKAKNEFWIRYDSGVWQKLPADAVNMIAFDLADINNDGLADIVGSWTHGNWWRDAASGVWERLSKQSPTFLAAGDFEGDGLMDVVGLYPDLASIWIYSRLATPQWKKISNQINLNDLRSGDVNADGKTEVLGSWDIGTWTFDYIANTWERHSAKPATVLCSGDIDGQGKKDIIGDWSPSIPGLWVKFMESVTWKRLSTKIPIDLCSGQVK